MPLNKEVAYEVLSLVKKNKLVGNANNADYMTPLYMLKDVLLIIKTPHILCADGILKSCN